MIAKVMKLDELNVWLTNPLVGYFDFMMNPKWAPPRRSKFCEMQQHLSAWTAALVLLVAARALARLTAGTMSFSSIGFWGANFDRATIAQPLCCRTLR
jgi:hypothetical protein